MTPTPMERARALDAKIRELGRQENEVQAQIAYELRRMKEEGLYAFLGKANIAAYAREALGYSSSKTRDLIALAQRLDGGLEKMKAAFMSGELDWTKARSASSAATPETEEVWLQKARTMSSRRLELEAKEERGEEPKTRSVFDWTAEERALIDDALNAVRESSDEALTDAQAMLEVARRALALAAGAGSSPYRVVIYVCERCDQGTRPTNDGMIPIAKAAVEEALCDAEIVDITEGPKALSRTMPPRVARFLDARDPWCGVPMCYKRVDLDRHHEGGWRKIGHDPDRCLRLCRKHHRQRHDGLLIIEGTYPDFVFKLSDGTVLEEPKPALVVAKKPAGASAEAGTDASRESPSGRPASPASTGESGPMAGVSSEAGPGASRDAGEASASASCEAGAAASREAPMSRRVLDETAIAALQRLEMKPREAQRAVRRAREMLAEPPTDVQTLLAAALRYA